MKKSLIFAIIATLMQLMLYGRAVYASDRQHISISAIQTGTKANGSDEYIKLYNPNQSPIDITGWKLQYRSAASTGTGSWTTKVTFTCQPPQGQAACQVLIPPQTDIIGASYDVAGKSFAFSGGMAVTGGQLQLIRPNGSAWTAEDMVGYGNAAMAEGNQPAAAPSADDAIVRRADSTGLPIDSDVNGADFILLSSLTPHSTPPQTQANYPALLITELLPDPASPATDDKDEFVELYNPNDVSVDAGGYVLQSGTNWRYSYTLPTLTLASGTYIALYSAQTKLTLSNSGTAVRLLDPNKEPVNEVPSYGAAKTGQSWMVDESSKWEWTTTPTPGAQNNLAVPAVAIQPATKAAATAKKPSPSAHTSKSTAPSSTKKPKSTASKQPGTGRASTPSATHPAASQPNDTLTYWLAGGSVAAAAGYAAYEYRKDIALRLGWLATKLKIRPRNLTLPDKSLLE